MENRWERSMELPRIPRVYVVLGSGSKMLIPVRRCPDDRLQTDPLNTNHWDTGENLETVYADPNGTIWIGFFGGMEQLSLATGNFQTLRHDSSDPGTLSAG